MEVKFFRFFQVLYLLKKQVYKLKLLKKWKIYGFVYMSLLEQDITRKKQIDKNVRQIEFDIGNSKEYKVKTFQNSMVYAKMSKLGYLAEIYYLIL